MSDDVRENRMRRVARRRGLELVKSRRRDARAIGYGRYHLRDRFTGQVIAAAPGGFALRDAPAARGGAERYACWLSLNSIERLLGEPWKLGAAEIEPAADAHFR